MIWQSVMVVLLGCTLAGNTLTSAVSFPRPVERQPFDIADSEELLKALEFLERYEGARRSRYPENIITDDIPTLGGDDYRYLPYDTLPTQDQLYGNQIPPQIPYAQYDTPLEDDYVDPYDLAQMLDIEEQEDDDRSMTIGERLDQDWETKQVINRLFEDAIMEEMLREDAAAAAELLEVVDDMEGEREEEENDNGFLVYDQEPEISNSEMDEDSYVAMPSFVLDDDYSDQDTAPALESFADYSESVDDDDGIDEGLVEAVIIKMTEDQMAKKLLENEGLDDGAELPFEENDSDDPGEDVEIDNFVAQIMSELLDGSENLADKLVSEIEDEKNMLEAEDTLDQGENEGIVDGAVFGDGWDKPEVKRGSDDELGEDLTCPALDIILDDCKIIDEFPGLGDGGYKDGFVEECNRHQLCYFCSGTFGIPKSLCDETYKVELMTLCDGDDECSFRAKYFWLSALASRTTTPAELDVCSQPCVVAYLLDN